MLKFYVITALITTLLMLITPIIRKNDKNIKAYIQKVSQENQGKTPFTEKAIIQIKLLITCWIPILNLVMIFFFLYVLLTSDLKLVKLIEKQTKTTEKEKEEFENILNHRD